MKFRTVIALFTLGIGGCFYPPTTTPPPVADKRARLAIPYDLAWDAVHAVVARNDFKIIAEDPNNGVIESEAQGGFSLKQADCGELRTIAAKYNARPNAEATAVYNFAVKPDGDEASLVTVQAVYTAVLHIPARPLSAEHCISRGVAETELLREIEKQSKLEHRPSFKPSSG